jgi:hypothetical protein
MVVTLGSVAARDEILTYCDDLLDAGSRRRRKGTPANSGKLVDTSP